MTLIEEIEQELKKFTHNSYKDVAVEDFIYAETAIDAIRIVLQRHAATPPPTPGLVDAIHVIDAAMIDHDGTKLMPGLIAAKAALNRVALTPQARTGAQETETIKFSEVPTGPMPTPFDEGGHNG